MTKDFKGLKSLTILAKLPFSFLIIFFTVPLTEEAIQWINDNVPLEPWQDKFQIAIEPRMFPDIRAGITEAMLSIEDVE